LSQLLVRVLRLAPVRALDFRAVLVDFRAVLVDFRAVLRRV
jgi:hypothetical protein